MVNSKNKGDTFERKTAKILGDWWGSKFSRTPQSGGAHWLADNNAVGDIVTPPHAGFPLVIECKHRESWTLDNVFLNNKEPHTWWAQVVGDSNRVDKVPCLIFTRNRAKIFVALPYVETIYEDVRHKSEPVMRTDFIIENIRKDKLYFDVIVMTIDTLTDFTPSYIKYHYDDFNLEPYRTVESETTEENKDEDKAIDNIMDRI